MFNDRLYSNSKGSSASKSSYGNHSSNWKNVRYSNLISSSGNSSSSERLSSSFNRGKDGIFRPKSIYSVATEIDFDSSRLQRSLTPIHTNPRLSHLREPSITRTSSDASTRYSVSPIRSRNDYYTSSSSYNNDRYDGYSYGRNSNYSSPLSLSPTSSYSKYSPGNYRFTTKYYAPKFRDRPLLSNLNLKFGISNGSPAVSSTPRRSSGGGNKGSTSSNHKPSSISSTASSPSGSSADHTPNSSTNTKPALERNKFLIKFREHEKPDALNRRTSSISWDIPFDHQHLVAPTSNKAPVDVIEEQEAENDLFPSPDASSSSDTVSLTRWKGSFNLNDFEKDHLKHDDESERIPKHKEPTLIKETVERASYRVEVPEIKNCQPRVTPSQSSDIVATKKTTEKAEVAKNKSPMTDKPKSKTKVVKQPKNLDEEAKRTKAKSLTNKPVVVVATAPIMTVIDIPSCDQTTELRFCDVNDSSALKKPKLKLKQTTAPVEEQKNVTAETIPQPPPIITTDSTPDQPESLETKKKPKLKKSATSQLPSILTSAESPNEPKKSLEPKVVTESTLKPPEPVPSPVTSPTGDKPKLKKAITSQLPSIPPSESSPVVAKEPNKSLEPKEITKTKSESKPKPLEPVQPPVVSPTTEKPPKKLKSPLKLEVPAAASIEDKLSDNKKVTSPPSSLLSPPKSPVSPGIKTKSATLSPKEPEIEMVKTESPKPKLEVLTPPKTPKSSEENKKTKFSFNKVHEVKGNDVKDVFPSPKTPEIKTEPPKLEIKSSGTETTPSAPSPKPNSPKNTEILSIKVPKEVKDDANAIMSSPKTPEPKSEAPKMEPKSPKSPKLPPKPESTPQPSSKPEPIASKNAEAIKLEPVRPASPQTKSLKPSKTDLKVPSTVKRTKSQKVVEANNLPLSGVVIKCAGNENALADKIDVKAAKLEPTPQPGASFSKESSETPTESKREQAETKVVNDYNKKRIEKKEIEESLDKIVVTKKSEQPKHVDERKEQQVETTIVDVDGGSQAKTTKSTTPTPKKKKKVISKKSSEKISDSETKTFESEPKVTVSNNGIQPEEENDKQSPESASSNQKLALKILDPFQKRPHQKKIRFREYCIDDFVFLTVLGRGSFGKVLLAELQNHECYFAIKCLRKQTVIDDDDVESIMIERKVLAYGTSHPFICKLFCTFQTESHLFFAMELCSGGDLMFHVQKETKFPESKAKFYASEILCAIWFLHKRSIIYRDLKLDNVMVANDGHIRLVDFGMCVGKTYREEFLPSNFCGTPEYMAPEIIKGVKYNHSVDYWALGVVIYEMCVGTSPFHGSDEDELLWNVCNTEVHYPKFLSEQVKNLVVLLLKKNPQERLGLPSSPHGDIVAQQWFHGVQWDLVEKCKVKPPFIPQLAHDADVSYFDQYFTKETPCITPCSKKLSDTDQMLFQGFNYTNHRMTD